MKINKIQQLAKNHAKKILDIGKENGTGFLIYAIAANILDEILIPVIFAYFGHPRLSLTILLGDLDWATYPIYFIGLSLKNKLKQTSINTRETV